MKQNMKLSKEMDLMTRVKSLAIAVPSIYEGLVIEAKPHDICHHFHDKYVRRVGNKDVVIYLYNLENDKYYSGFIVELNPQDIKRETFSLVARRVIEDPRSKKCDGTVLFKQRVFEGDEFYMGYFSESKSKDKFYGKFSGYSVFIDKFSEYHIGDSAYCRVKEVSGYESFISAEPLRKVNDKKELAENQNRIFRANKLNQILL